MGTECIFHLQIWLSLFSGCLSWEMLSTSNIFISWIHRTACANYTYVIPVNTWETGTSHNWLGIASTHPVTFQCLGIQEEEGSAIRAARDSLPHQQWRLQIKGFLQIHIIWTRLSTQLSGEQPTDSLSHCSGERTGILKTRTIYIH